MGWVRTACGIGVSVLVAAHAAQPATAQPAAAAAGQTVLHLSADGSVQASPDQLVADLIAQSTSPSAATAQRRVNTMIDDGMKAARGVAGVDARAIGYSVGPADDKHATWVAQQTLELRGNDGPSLLDLAGKLQERGLAAASLDWQLSPALRRKAHDAATTAALKTLQARAASAAATLGLHVDHAREVRLDGPMYQPRPPFPMMARAALAMPAPQATAAPEEITATVSANYVLVP